MLVGKKSATCAPTDFPRALSEWPRTDFIDKAIRNIIISSLFSSEVKQGGSAVISAMMLLDEVEILEQKKRCSETDVEKVIFDWSHSGLSARIAREVFYMGGCGSEVNISESDSTATQIKCTSGIMQNAEIANGFLSENISDFSIDEKTHIVAIDGFVEKVSQIHHLLEGLEKQSLLLLARGFLPDVVNTLSVNYPHKIRCIPMTVKDWCVPEFLSLEKLGVSCVSADAGMEISSASLEDLIPVSINSNSIIIKSNSEKKRKIFVQIGRDLQDLKGLTIDRVKTLVTLSRFTSRKGVTKIRYKDHEMHVPTSSYEAAVRCKKSMENIFQQIGGVIAIQNEGENRGKRKAKRCL